MTSEEIKSYLVDTFTDFEDIKTVIVAGHQKVTDAFLNDAEYPLLWFMWPPQRKTIYDADIKKKKWSFDMYVLRHANFDDEEQINTNFDVCQVIAEMVLNKLEFDAYDLRQFEFIEDENTGEWLPKEQYGNDNCNGWYIPLSIVTV